MDLYWIPLGAGAHVVRISGKVFEALSAFAQRRPRRNLYHSALVVHSAGASYVIEQAPVSDGHGERRGVAAGGAVGMKWLGRFRVFRYEVRRWRDGRIPDLAAAVASPVRVSNDSALVERLLALVPSIPTPVWGRDEFGAGEMWNSNSFISWLLATSGVDVDAIEPPDRGRAPGWNAGLTVAQRLDPRTG